MTFVCVGGNVKTNLVIFLCREYSRQLLSHPGLETLQIVTPHLLQYVLKGLLKIHFNSYFFSNNIFYVVDSIGFQET